MSKFPARLKQLCDLHDITQTKLARDIGYTPPAVSNWIRGKTEPNLDTLVRLAQYFNMSVDFLVGNDVPYRKDPTSIDIIDSTDYEIHWMLQFRNSVIRRQDS